MATYRYNVGVSWPGIGSPGVNVWHFRTDNDPDDFTDGPIALIKQLYAAINGSFPTPVTWTGPSEAIQDPYGSPTYAPVTSWSLTGAGSSLTGNRSTQACITWRTNSATRSGRGRTFLGPLAPDAVDTGTGRLAAGLVSTLQSAANALVSGNGNIANGAVGVFSRSDGVLRDITQARVRDIPAVLRSRRD